MKNYLKAVSAFTAISAATMLFAHAAETPAADARRTVGVYIGQGQPSATANAAIGALSGAGYKIATVSAEAAVADSAVSPEKFFLYVIPDAPQYPADGFDRLGKFLAGKGNLVTLGGPAFTRPLCRVGAGAEQTWMTKDAYEERINQTVAAPVVFDFESPLAWKLECGDLARTAGKIGPADGGAKGKCLAYEIADLPGYAYFQTDVPAAAFPADNNALCLQAKGDERTKQIFLELDEADGSRWIYVLSISSEWKNHAIYFDDFEYWHDSITKNKRGQAGDHLNPAKVASFCVGLAGTHTPVGGGEHRFWIDELGSGKNPLPNVKKNSPAPNIETISPKYKVYPLIGITALKPASGEIATGKFSVGENLWSPISRPQGGGFTGQNPWRWIPLVDAFAGNERRGSVASLLIQNTGAAAGSVCASFGTDSLDAPMAKVLADAARRIETGLFLTEAGSEFFSYYPGETVRFGARLMNGGNAGRTVTVRMQALSGGKQIWSAEKSVAVKARGATSVEFSSTSAAAKAFTMRTELLADGKTLDVIEHEVGILSERNHVPAASEFVSVRGSDFYCEGRKWYPVGVNYWPSYIAGWDGEAYWGKWLAPGFYNPAGVEEDLARMERMGLNMASIQMYPNFKDGNNLLADGNVRNLLDFLRRCGNHGIKVNGFLPHASPLAISGADPLDERLVAEFINGAGLANNPVLFAYDTIWEPGYQAFNDDGRKATSGDWNRWIVERYGSAANAVADWNFAPECVAGKISPPRTEQMTADGAWRIYVAAYRRFMDDFTSKRWQTAHRAIHRHDPRHLISYRQGNTTPVDFGLTGPVKHLDFISPEAYSFPFNADGADCAGFATRYIHFTSGGKPVYWAEFGRSVWDLAAIQPSEQLIVEQGDYVREIYKMTLESGANGLAPWWWPGGFRADENSDFGINNPDGTPRAAAVAARGFAPRLKAARDYPAPDEWLTVDRDAHAGGYSHIIQNVGGKAYHKTRAAGKNLGVKSAVTGTDSANTPLLAVGNVPCNGHNPPKYLNAEFNGVSVKAADGRWVDIFENGQTVEVAVGKPVLMKASIGNLGEAAWLAPKNHPGAGGVYLAARTGDVTFREPILADTAHLQDAATAEFTLVPAIGKKTEVVLEMTALDRAWFGEKFHLTLSPK